MRRGQGLGSFGQWIGHLEKRVRRYSFVQNDFYGFLLMVAYAVKLMFIPRCGLKEIVFQFELNYLFCYDSFFGYKNALCSL